MKRLLLCILAACPLFLSGCVLDTILGDIVNQAPRAVIDAAPETGAAPLEVAFDAHYSHDDDGTIVEYHWDFGDPADRVIGQQSSCTHTYARPGTYLARLTLVDDEGATDTQQIAVIVTNPPPVPQALVSNDNPQPGTEVLFDASGSYDQGGTIVSYQWDFGDGSSANGEIVTHTYMTGGYYVVTLTLVDDETATAATCLGMNVLAGQSNCGGDDPTCGGGNPRPIAVITGIPPCSVGTVGVPLHFDGTASRPGDGATRVTSYRWDLGDGTTATGPLVTHVYKAAQRSVLITLTVTNEFNESNTAIGHFAIGASTCP